MTIKWVLLNPDGTTAASLVMLEGETPVGNLRDNPGNLDAVQVQRWGWRGERIDRATGLWHMVDADEELAAVDAAHLADHGPYAICDAHISKLLEARVIIAGIAVEGYVAAEARALGIDILVRAHQVDAAARADGNPDLERIKAKTKIRRDAGQ